MWRVRGLALLVSAGAFVALAAPAGGATSTPIPTDQWIAKANDACRVAAGRLNNVTPPNVVLRESIVDRADVRSAGGYYDQLGELENVAATSIRQLPAPIDQASTAANMVAAFSATAASNHQVFTLSRSPKLHIPRDLQRFTHQIADSDSHAAAAGDAAEPLGLAQCLILFGGNSADHQNLHEGDGTNDVPQCFNDPNFGNEDVVNPQDVPCASPHGFETFGVTRYPVGITTNFPGDNPLGEFGDAICAVRFRRFVGIDQRASNEEAQSVTPTQDVWNQGDHTINCVLEANQPLTGSMQNSKQ